MNDLLQQFYYGELNPSAQSTEGTEEMTGALADSFIRGFKLGALLMLEICT